MEYYGIVDSHLSRLYLLLAKEVGTLDINDFLYEAACTYFSNVEALYQSI
jgi:hypothetical protein